MTERFEGIIPFVKRVLSLVEGEEDWYKKSTIVNDWLEDNNIELSSGENGLTVDSQTPMGKLLTQVMAIHAVQFDEVGLINRGVLA